MNFRRNLLIIVFNCSFLLLIASDLSAQMRTFGGTTTGRSSYSGAAGMREYLTKGMIGEAMIQVDYDSRSIIVITDEETNEHIKQIVENLDRPVQQVLIKVVFLEVTYRDDLDFGLEGTLDVKKRGANGSIFETMFGLAAESRGGFYRLLENDVQLTLRALSEVGKLEVLSRPSILTRNNQEAVITVGQRFPFVTDSRVTSDGQTINTVTYQDIGIILRVTPFITQDGLVEMILSPEISTLTDETVPISDTIESPVFAIRSADTVVNTPNGQTVVIGGMMEDNSTETNRKVPILGDIPLLGLAFQRKVKNNSKTELLIFLTPYVVENPDKLVDLAAREKSHTQLAPKAFTQDQMDKFFDNVPEKETGAPDAIQPLNQEQVPDTETKAVNRKSKSWKPLRIQ
ncbi:MAG: hypothetical protein C4527_15175 [Candidatus Omnitrophota bacterium]|jgi:general secretion pathway protein D|nr:MAG: hypothetical protein C4527_15175 [Candidatus Omnitrophota bacterium]